MTREDLTGKRFGLLTVVENAGTHVTSGGSKKQLWLCRCDCGTVKTVRGENLKNGSTKSCGCWKYSKIKEHNTKHGGVHDRLYGIWKNMKHRCDNPKDSHYKTYGERGIRVCDDWNDYANFKAWAYSNGYDENAETGICTLDRIDNDGNYEPSNCRFTDRITQANNTSQNHFVELNGHKMTISEFARTMNISKNHAWYYLNKFEREVANG